MVESNGQDDLGYLALCHKAILTSVLATVEAKRWNSSWILTRGGRYIFFFSIV